MNLPIVTGCPMGSGFAVAGLAPALAVTRALEAEAAPRDFVRGRR